MCPPLCDPMDHSTPGFPVLPYLPEFTQTHEGWVDDAIQPPHSVSPPSLALSLSQHQGLISSESALCIRWAVYWSFSFRISPSNEYSGLIFFMMDWLDLLAVQGTLKSLLQHLNSVIQTFVYIFLFTLFSIIDYYIEYSSLCYTVGPYWSSVLYAIVCIY